MSKVKEDIKEMANGCKVLDNLAWFSKNDWGMISCRTGEKRFVDFVVDFLKLNVIFCYEAQNEYEFSHNDKVL